MKIACSLALLCGGTAADPSLRGAEAWPRQLQAAPSTTGPSEETVVPSCAAGYVDITGGSAYVWTCAFYCEGGPNFATDTCICACLTPDQIERLGLDLNASTTVPQVGDSDQILVTRKPVTEAPFSAPVEEAPVGELFDGPSRPTAAPAPAPYVVVGSDVSTTTVPDTGPVLIVETDWQIILLFLIGSFLIIVAVSMVLVFAHRNGFLGAVLVAKTKDLSIHVSDEPAKPEEVKDNRLTPDKLSALRRDSQLSNGSKMSASAVTALDHLQKLRETGDASAAGAAQHHLDTLHMALRRARRATRPATGLIGPSGGTHGPPP